MANPRTPGTAVPFNAYQADICTASSAYFVFDRDGVVVAAQCVTAVAVTTADNAITATLNGTAVTGFAGTVGTTGAAIGARYVMTVPKKLVVTAGDVLAIVSDGAGSATVPTFWTVTVAVDRAI